MSGWILDVYSPFLKQKGIVYKFPVGENMYCVREVQIDYNWGEPQCNGLLIDDEIEYHKIFETKEEAIAAARTLKHFGYGV